MPKMSEARVEFLRSASRPEGTHAVEEYKPAQWAIKENYVTVVEGRFGNRVHRITPSGVEVLKKAEESQ